MPHALPRLALAPILGLFLAGTAQAKPVCPADGPDPAFSAKAAWEELRGEMAGNYAYWDRIDAAKAFDQAAQAMLAAPDRLAFADRLETLLLVFRDSHLHVSPTSSPSSAWVPSAADMWFEASNGKLVVRDVKGGSVAAERGVRPGWELVAIDGADPRTAVRARFAAIGLTPDAAQEVYGVNAMASGKLKQARHFTFRVGKKKVEIDLPPGYDSVRRPAELVTLTQSRDAAGHLVGVLRINNSLGDNKLIAAFDQALGSLPQNAHVIIDMRDTPSGGNSTVARGIMGHFVDAARPYQRHELTAERVQFGVPRIWTEYVEPRGSRYARPVVLAGLWTGSMGEGIVIGLNAAAGSPVVGSQMGQLLGAMINDELPASCLTVSFANEKLWHFDGRPREDFMPQILVAAADTSVDGRDTAMENAMALASTGD